MKAVCVENDVKNLPLSQRGAAGAYEGPHPLTKGNYYYIHAMVLLENRLLYLVLNDFDYPRFHPAAFFGPFTGPVPSWWCYGIGEDIRADGVAAILAVQSIWGYPEMVQDPKHRERLILGDVEAQNIFDKYVEMSKEA